MIETKHHEPIVYKIYDYLKEHCVGEENAISARDLAAQYQMSERALRDVIREIRTSGELTRTVGSGNRGYFICKDNDEFEKANNILWAAAYNMLKTASANAKKAGLEGQGKIKMGEFYQEFVHAFGD